MKKKLLLTSLTLGLLCSASAHAETNLNVDLDLGGPAIVEPAPVYAAPVVVAQPAYIVHPWVHSWDPHHRAADWRYWQERKARDHGHWDHR